MHVIFTSILRSWQGSQSRFGFLRWVTFVALPLESGHVSAGAHTPTPKLVGTSTDASSEAHGSDV